VPGQQDFQLAYQVSPIYLTGGVAANLAGGTLPVISLLQSSSFPNLLGAGDNLDLDGYFAQFLPLPGSSLLANAIGTYPFANQQTAANAIITMPLKISLMMICPERQPGDYAAKLSIMSALQATLAQHALSGGTFTVATPSYLYTNCILTALHDVSGQETHKWQWRWQWDFEQPLVSLAAAAAAQNNLMSQLTNQTQVTPNANGEISGSGAAATIGNPASNVAQPVVPAAQSLPAQPSGIGSPMSPEQLAAPGPTVGIPQPTPAPL